MCRQQQETAHHSSPKHLPAWENACHWGYICSLFLPWGQGFEEKHAHVQVCEVQLSAGHSKGKLAPITCFAYTNCHVLQIKPLTRNQTIKLLFHNH